MEHLNTLKDYVISIGRDNYFYQDPFEEYTTIFVFHDFDNFYTFITRDDNCLHEQASEELWNWYSTGYCCSYYILCHHQHSDIYVDVQLKSQCVCCLSYYEMGVHPYDNRHGSHTTFHSKALQGNIMVRYTSNGKVTIEYRMICKWCVKKTSQRFIYLIFEELKEKIGKKNTMERIHMIGSLQEKLNSYHLGEYRLSKYIITFIS